MARLRDRLREVLRDPADRGGYQDGVRGDGTGAVRNAQPTDVAPATLPPAQDDAGFVDDQPRAPAGVTGERPGDAGQEDATCGRPAAGDSDQGPGNPRRLRIL